MLLGARREQMKKSMHRQVLYYFLLPLGLACISGTVGLYVMQKYLSPSVASDAPFYLMASIMAGIVILILAVYAIAVARTADREIAKTKLEAQLLMGNKMKERRRSYWHKLLL